MPGDDVPPVPAGSGRVAPAAAPDEHDRILVAAAQVLAQIGIARAGRREVAQAAATSARSVAKVGPHRMDLLREVVATLPYPPTARMLADQAANPTEPALQALLRAARQVLGDPGSAWDPVELQAIAVAPYDADLAAVLDERLTRRWRAAQEVVRQLRRPDRSADDPAVANATDRSAALHVVAVGLGLALLGPLVPRWSNPEAWSALSGRLLEALTTVDAEPVRGRPRRWRARVAMPLTPTAMADLLRVLARLGVHVDSLFTAVLDDERQLVDMFLVAPDDTDRASIVHGLTSVATDVIVTRGLPADAEDVATRVLRLAARLATEPDAAPRAAADLVLADSWEVTTAAQGADASALVLRLQWTPERHVVLRRTRAPFTGTEADRASALLTLVAALSRARGEPDGFGWRESLADGEPVVIRLARPADAERVARMHERASERSRYQRYFAPMNQWRADNLRRIAGGHRGATLVVTVDGDDDDDRLDGNGAGEVIALGNVFPAGPDATDVAEIAVIVEDAWHGRGVGRVLMLRLIDVATRMGFDRLVAYVLADNTAMLSLLAATGRTWEPVASHDLGPSVVAVSCRL